MKAGKALAIFVMALFLSSTFLIFIELPVVHGYVDTTTFEGGNRNGWDGWWLNEGGGHESTWCLMGDWDYPEYNTTAVTKQYTFAAGYNSTLDFWLKLLNPDGYIEEAYIVLQIIDSTTEEVYLYQEINITDYFNVWDKKVIELGDVAGGSTSNITMYLHATGFPWVYAQGTIDDITASIGEVPTPSVTIYSPISTTYAIKVITVNFTAAGGTIDKMWYNVWMGSGWLWTNKTYTSPTTMTLQNGTFTFYAWANNTGGKTGVTTVTFSVNVAVTVTITMPTGKYIGHRPWIQFDASCYGTIHMKWYNIYSYASSGFIGIPIIYTVPVQCQYLPTGSYLFYAYANSTVGEVGYVTASFTTMDAINVVQNNGFEDGFSNWQKIMALGSWNPDPYLQIVSSPVHGGNSSLYIKDSTNIYGYQDPVGLIQHFAEPFSMASSATGYIWARKYLEMTGNFYVAVIYSTGSANYVYWDVETSQFVYESASIKVFTMTTTDWIKCEFSEIIDMTRKIKAVAVSGANYNWWNGKVYVDDLMISEVGTFSIDSVVIKNRDCLDAMYDETDGTGWVICETKFYHCQINGTYVDPPDSLWVYFQDEQGNIVTFGIRGNTSIVAAGTGDSDFVAVNNQGTLVYTNEGFCANIYFFPKNKLVDTWFVDLYASGNDTIGYTISWTKFKNDYFNIYSHGGLNTMSGMSGQSPIDKSLKVNGWTNVLNQWTHYGNLPYLDSDDGDTSGAKIGVTSENMGKENEYYDFQDSGISDDYEITKVELIVKAALNGRTGRVSIRAYLWDGSEWRYNPMMIFYQWTTYTSIVLFDATQYFDTAEKINGARLKIMLLGYEGEEGGEIRVTYARLRVQGFDYSISISGIREGGDVFQVYCHNSSYASSALVYRDLVHTSALYELTWTIPSQFMEFNWATHTITGGLYPNPEWKFGLGYYVDGKWVPAGVFAVVRLDSFFYGEDSSQAYYAKFIVDFYRSKGTSNDFIYSSEFISFVHVDRRPDPIEWWINAFLTWFGWGGLETNATLTSKVYVDHWWNKANASSLVGMRVGAYEYGMINNAPWYGVYIFGNDWAIFGKERAVHMAFVQNQDLENDVFYYKDVEMMIPYVTVSQGIDNTDQIGCISDVLEYNLYFSPDEGIDTPAFKQPQIPALPSGGLVGLLSYWVVSMWNNLLNPIFRYIWSGIAYLLDEALFLLTGQRNLFSSFIAMIVALLSGVVSFMVTVATMFVDFVTVVASTISWFFGTFFGFLWGAVEFIIVNPAFNVLNVIGTIFGVSYAWLAGTTYTNAFGQVYDFTYLSNMQFAGLSGGIVIFVVLFVVGFFLTILRCLATLSLAPILEPIALFWAFVQFIITVFETIIAVVHKVVQLLIQAVNALRNLMPKILGTG